MAEGNGPEVMQMEPSDLGDFICNNFKIRECAGYVQDPKCKGTRICYCGREHSQHTKTQPDGEWKTETSRSRSFGEILFRGFGHMPASHSPYVRIGHDTDVEKILILLTNFWHMKPPRLLISVTGGAKTFYIKPQLLNTFKRGLINAATSTDAWIVTGGTNAGVMKYIGEAVREHVITTGMAERHMVAIGVATWGIVNNKKALAGTESEPRGNHPAKYDIEDLDPDSDGICALDHNHTHFILVDDGTEKKYGREINIRTSLEKHISELSLTDQDKNLKVPVVLLVLEGGPNTLETAARAVEKNTPVVVVQGSGRAADLIAEFCWTNKPHETRVQDRIIKKRATETFDDKPIDKETQEKVAANIKVLMEKAKESLVTVINLDRQGSATEIDQAILHALFQSKKSDVRSQLDLALAWNRSDVARKEIFTVENRHKWKELHVDLNNAMFTALVQDMVDFAKLLLDNGLDLNKFLTREKLGHLYSGVVHESRAGTMENLLQHLMQSQQKGKKESIANLKVLKVVGQVLVCLLVDQFENVYEHEKKISKGDEEGHLLLWATLLNRRDLAFLFWKNGKDHIGSALRASALLKSLAKEADKQEEGDLSISLRTNSEFFEALSVGVLNECYKRDKNKAHKLLVRPQEKELNQNPLLLLAYSAEFKDFMGHSCCQTKLACIWMGKMALYTPMWKIIAAMFLPPIVFCIKFSTNERPDMSEVKMNESEKETLRCERSNSTRKPHEVTCCSTGSSETINFFEALYYYHTAPVVKFLYHTLAHVIFLCLFSFFLLTDLHPISSTRSPSAYEYITWLWAGSMLIEEFRQMMTRNPGSSKMPTFYGSLKANMSQYVTSFWNWLDLVIYMVLIVSVALRLTLPPKTFIWAQRFYAITLVLCFMRFLNVFFVWEKIGPKVIMIKEMLYDLASFIIIMATFLLAYGISTHALQFPNSVARWDLLQHVVYHPYWHIYGELSLENLEGNVNDCPTNGTLDSSDPAWRQCPQRSWLVFILFAVYMILTHVLLLNLLIAMFSYTFQKVQDESRKVWKYYRYTLIEEYLDRPTLVPPFILMSFIFRFLKFVCYKMHCREHPRHELILEISDEEDNKLTMFERAGMEDYILKNPSICNEQADVGADSGVSSDVIYRLEGQLTDQSKELANQSEQIANQSKQLIHQSEQMQQLVAKIETLMDMHTNNKI